jgi:hypothetical protein
VITDIANIPIILFMAIDLEVADQHDPV